MPVVAPTCGFPPSKAMTVLMKLRSFPEYPTEKNSVNSYEGPHTNLSRKQTFFAAYFKLA